MTRQERLEFAPMALLLACVVAVVGLVVRYADALDGPVVVVTTRPAVYDALEREREANRRTLAGPEVEAMGR